MLRIRRFEERTAELFSQGLITGTAHSCIGQEAVAVGAAAALRPDDYIAGHHRSHGHVIAKGGDLHAMMAELLGRRTGYCSGLGGSMHIADLALGILGCNGIAGAPLPLGVGAALSSTCAARARSPSPSSATARRTKARRMKPSTSPPPGGSRSSSSARTTSSRSRSSGETPRRRKHRRASQRLRDGRRDNRRQRRSRGPGEGC